MERSEATGDPQVDAVWEDEIERRIRSIDAGIAQSRPFSQVVAQIDRQLGG
ncbi:MAG: addiction module protein [Chthoniobacterales bacterium]|nr:addiction module protein [Chthoniobacterales bacterium]